MSKEVHVFKIRLQPVITGFMEDSSFPYVLNIENLSYRTTEETLIVKANTFGNALTKLLMNRDGLSKGIATMAFQKKEQAQKAFKTLHQSLFEGRQLKVSCDESLKTHVEMEQKQNETQKTHTDLVKNTNQSKKNMSTKQPIKREASSRISGEDRGSYRDDPRSYRDWDRNDIDNRRRDFVMRERLRDSDYMRSHYPPPDPWRDDRAMLRRAESYSLLYDRYRYPY